MLDLGPIKAREKAATAGPWFGYKEKTECVACDIPTGCEYTVSARNHVDICFLYADKTGADAVFVAQARTDIPNLIAEVERLRALLAATTKE